MEPVSSVPSEKLSETGLSPEFHGQSRQLARNTLKAVGNSAASLTSQIKSSSGLFKFGIETVEKLMSPAKSFTVDKWNSYGDPLLSSFDQKLNVAIDAFGNVAAQSPQAPPMDSRAAQNYRLYWDGLKIRFAQSKWFAKVDAILLQNSFVQRVSTQVTSQVVRPAEMFFNTATDVFLEDDSSFETFLQGMKDRMGPAWDDQLVGPCKAFFATSKACQTLVGAGKFFGGALQLGKQRFNTVIDELIERLDHVLGITDDAVEHWLPDTDNPPRSVVSLETQQSSTVDSLPRTESAPVGSPDVTMDVDVNWDRHTSPTFTSTNTEEKLVMRKDRQSVKRRVMPCSIASKVSKRLRQRLPLVTELPTQLKSRLMDSSWFQRVDEILSQNTLVRLMQAQMAAAREHVSRVVSRPAEHFYNTSVQTFLTNYRSVEDFLSSLRQHMGAAWDERLTHFAVSFFHSAKQSLGSVNQAASPADSVLDPDTCDPESNGTCELDCESMQLQESTNYVQ